MRSSCPGRSAKRVFALDVPGIHVLGGSERRSLMAGTSPAMTLRLPRGERGYFLGTLCPLLMLDRGHQRCSAQKSCWSTAPRVDLRRTTPRHALQIRPPDRPRPANHPSEAGAAYPHADPELFAQGHSGQSFCELAAG